ncbi:SLAM family member 5-like [Anomaloglossus baeobatrachus]|uniref:SLAM family member 5-like n=1 Tax=Anomaloglossus baeobatrachus TaxID=238106 RepID=UPI003F508C5C
MTTMILFFLILLCARYMETTTVVGVLRENVTLNVHEKNVDDITWTYDQNRIAATGPQKPINVTRTYRGKLASDQNGSLIIMHLQQEDEGMYGASIKLRNGEMREAQYQLQVYQKLSVEDIKIEHNVSSHEPCDLNLTCTANGFDVIISWTSSGLNVTSNVVNVRNPGPETRYTCVAQNPISHPSKSVTPVDYCKKGNRRWIGGIVFLSVFIGIIVVIFIIFKTKLSKCRNETVPS